MTDKKGISELSTHCDQIKWLGSPGHELYQKCWEQFYQRYHEAIIDYILKRAHWGNERINEAEDIASKVYEKGYRWSFSRAQGVRFRVVLKRLVKDALSDYQKKMAKDRLVFVEVEKTTSVKDCSLEKQFSQNILETSAELVLKEYSERQRNVVSWIWDNGRWPKSLELADVLQVQSVGEKSRRAAAQQWKKRNKDIWQDFQSKLANKITDLALGEENQQNELCYFQNLSD